MKSGFFLCLVSFICLSTKISAQFITLNGNVKDNLNQNLFGANILIFPLGDSKLSPVYTVTDEKGDFSIEVAAKATYRVTISFIGFETQETTLRIGESSITVNYTMKESLNQLEEVVLNYDPPVVVKKDTTIFTVSSFTNGRERKLAEVLKKLPGIEVNRKGEVFFKNKKITKVLLENNIFFNGQSKIAVENIPGDVIEKIEIIEDYHETEFLKGLIESEEQVLNIVLREDKKKFIFGDLEFGGNSNNNYRINPSIFRYTPTFSMNFIGDLNNTGLKSFEIADYLNFEGELNVTDLGEALNSNLARFLGNQDFFKNKHEFGGFNAQWNPNNHHQLRIFLVGLKDKTYVSTLRDIVYNQTGALENREKNRLKNSELYTGNINYTFRPNKNTVLKFKGNFENILFDSNEENETETLASNLNYRLATSSKNLNIKSNILLEKQFSQTHTSRLNLSFKYSKSFLNDNWLSETDLFNPELPILNNSFFNIFGTEHLNSSNYGLLLNHYYRVSRKDLITFELFFNVDDSAITNQNGQILTGDSKFIFGDFNGDFTSNLGDINSSIAYKKIINKFDLSIGLSYRNVYWTDKNLNRNNSFFKTSIQPLLKLEYKINDKKNLKFTYNNTRSNPSSDIRVENKKIRDFNSVFQGNPFLEQYSQQRILFSYRSFKTYGLSTYAKIGQRTSSKEIVNSNNFNGINFNIEPIQIDSKNLRYDLGLKFNYNKRFWKLVFGNNLYYSERNSIFFGSPVNTISRSAISSLDFQTNFEKYPNMNVKVNNSWRISNNIFLENTTINTNLSINLDYNLKNWKIQSNFDQTFYNNKSQSTFISFNQIELDVFYHKEDSLWEFGINFYNLSNNKRKITNSFTANRFVEEETILFPRTILFNIFYKL